MSKQAQSPCCADALSGTEVERPYWDQVKDRIAEYLYAIGVCDPLEQEMLIDRVRVRFDARNVDAHEEDPLEAGIAETERLLDDWLAAELDIASDRLLLLPARAALLSGAVPGWSAHWVGLRTAPLAARIQAASVAAVPPTERLSMEPNAIHLCCDGLGSALLRMLRDLFPWGTAARPRTGSQS